MVCPYVTLRLSIVLIEASASCMNFSLLPRHRCSCILSSPLPCPPLTRPERLAMSHLSQQFTRTYVHEINQVNAIPITHLSRLVYYCCFSIKDPVHQKAIIIHTHTCTLYHFFLQITRKRCVSTFFLLCCGLGSALQQIGKKI